MKLHDFLSGALLLGLGAIRLHAESSLTQGLVAHYPFRGDANDASGNGYHGVVHGATPVQDQALRPGSAYRLNGVTDYIYADDSEPRVQLIKAVKPIFANLAVGTNYQLQLSPDMSTWTNHGSPFTATNRIVTYPQYWDVDNWSGLHFRLQVLP